jgi:hypothetical protein
MAVTLAKTYPKVLMLDLFIIKDFTPTKWMFTDCQDRLQCFDIRDKFTLQDVVMSIAKNLQTKTNDITSFLYDSDYTNIVNPNDESMNDPNILFTNDDFIEVLETRL